MANQVVIDIEARFTDNVTGAASSASKALEEVESEARDAAKAIDSLGKKDAEPTIDVDNTQATAKIDDTEKRLKKIGRQTTQTKLSALDKATAIIDKVTSKAKAFGSKTYSALVKIRDSNALSSLNKMSSKMQSFTSKAWSVAVKVKDYATAPLRGIKNMLFSMQSLVMAIGAGIATQKLVINPVNVADAYSSAKISFSTLLGESQGQQMMNNLDEFAKKTPFNTTNVIDNAQKMLAMGWEAENIIEDMEIIGNAAAATGKLDVGLESIVRALSQIKTKGKLSTEELNQLAEAGISAKAMLAEQMGYGTGDKGIAKMTKDLEDGKIASNEAIAALLAGMKKYDGMMDSMANETVDGLISQLGDAFSINIVRKWGQGLQDGARRGLGTVVDLLDDAESAMEEFGDTVYEVGKTISNWAADKLEDAVKKITEITGSFEFQNASLGEKIKMLWNGVVVDPLKEWWEGGGQEKTAETAGKIGSWMGKMLCKGLLALFGATDVLNGDIGADAGSNIAGSFLQGFLDNFDGQAVTDAFVDAISNVWGALPDWAKILLGVYGVGKAAGGIANFAGGITNFISGASSFIGNHAAGTGLLGAIGSTGNYMVSGTGLLGGLANAGYALTGGPASAGAFFGAGMSGGTAALLGGAGIAGGIAGGAAAIKGGVDLYKSYQAHKVGDSTEAKAYGASGGTALGGVAAGAAAGAAIGSIIPVIGTAVGALVGAGIGGVAGWIGGNAWADNIRSARYESEAMKEAIKDSDVSAEELADIFEKAKWENAREHFGDIKLSMAEITRLANQIVWGDDIAHFEKFSAATKAAEENLQSLKTAAAQTDRWMWKAGLGVKFNEDETESIKASFNDYINSAKAYIENRHYEFTAAVSMLVDVDSYAGNNIIESGNAFYGALQEQLNNLGSELSGKVEIALEDGVITLDEEKEITNLQQQIAEITEKLANSEQKAELELMKVKFGNGNLDYESFENFMTQMQSTIDARMEANDKAFVVSVSSLNLQLEEGAINQEEYNTQLQALIDGYNSTNATLRGDIKDVELQIVGDAYNDLLGADAAQDLNEALQYAITNNLKPVTITNAQLADLLHIEASSLPEETAANIKEMLTGVYNQLGQIPVDIDTELYLKPTLDPVQAEQAIISPITGLDIDAVDKTVDVIATPNGIFETLHVSADDFNIDDYVSKTIDIYLNGNVHYSTNDGTGGQGYRGGIFGGTSSMDAFARGGITDNGGIVGGSTRFIRVNEESPEMVIPLSSQRRERAMKLWMKTGELLGVDGFFRGGRTDGGAEDWAEFKTRNSGGVSGSGQSVHVEVGGITIEVHVEGGDPDSIAAAIREQMPEITEMVAGIMNDAFTGQFENTPVRGGAA